MAIKILGLEFPILVQNSFQTFSISVSVFNEWSKISQGNFSLVHLTSAPISTVQECTIYIKRVLWWAVSFEVISRVWRYIWAQNLDRYPKIDWNLAPGKGWNLNEMDCDIEKLLNARMKIIRCKDLCNIFHHPLHQDYLGIWPEQTLGRIISEHNYLGLPCWEQSFSKIRGNYRCYWLCKGRMYQHEPFHLDHFSFQNQKIFVQHFVSLGIP